MALKGVLMAILIISVFAAGYLGYLSYTNFYSPSEGFSITYGNKITENNFTDDSSQFYPNLRFKDRLISYSIGGECSAEKEDNMLKAFSFLENKSNLRFIQLSNSQIRIQCKNEYLIGDFFVAGEGGPTTITRTSLFNIIQGGEIALLKSENCQHSSYNVELHELLHVLGFNHSTEKRSIMYNTSSCNQVTPDSIILKLNQLYSYESLPDLYFEDVSAIKRGSYLNINISVKNQGLETSKNFTVLLITDTNFQQTLEFENIEAGRGRILAMQNFKIPPRTENINLEIKNSQELNLENNKLSLALS